MPFLQHPCQLCAVNNDSHVDTRSLFKTLKAFVCTKSGSFWLLGIWSSPVHVSHITSEALANLLKLGSKFKATWAWSFMFNYLISMVSVLIYIVKQLSSRVTKVVFSSPILAGDSIPYFHLQLDFETLILIGFEACLKEQKWTFNRTSLGLKLQLRR